ncbi:50S ribosomal protein L22 [Patescibacteria group bacterium]|nr:50S ribosomal protein L22 [Patescibacteria group bacterium]
MIRETVKLKYLHIAPRKARLVANLIKGLSVNEAEAELIIRPKRSTDPILKLLRSGVSNVINNQKIDSEKLIIEKIIVDQGPSFKRFLPRAMGRATPILKRTCHITMVLKEVSKKKVSRFNTTKPKKDKKAKKIIKAGKEKKEAISKHEDKKEFKSKEASVSSDNKQGFIKKMFRRKSI